MRGDFFAGYPLRCPGPLAACWEHIPMCIIPSTWFPRGGKSGPGWLEAGKCMAPSSLVWMFWGHALESTCAVQ